jgi:hypothetical protein
VREFEEEKRRIMINMTRKAVDGTTTKTDTIHDDNPRRKHLGKHLTEKSRKEKKLVEKLKKM